MTDTLTPGGFEKIPHISWIFQGFFFLDILLPFLYIRLILKQVLIIQISVPMGPDDKCFGFGKQQSVD